MIISIPAGQHPAEVTVAGGFPIRITWPEQPTAEQEQLVRRCVQYAETAKFAPSGPVLERTARLHEKAVEQLGYDPIQ